MRVRYNIALGFMNFKLLSYDKLLKTYIIIRKELVSEAQNHQKLKLINNYLFCTCMEYFNTGLPC